MGNYSEIQKAWLAGFIDGEGYIGITFQRNKETRKSSATPKYHPFLIIVNTNKNILDIIMDFIGDGRLYIAHRAFNRSKQSY